MNIKFSIKNETKINALLDSVNGKAAGHTYTTYADFVVDAQNVILKIETLLGGKKYCIGSKFSIESGGAVSSGYKYARAITRLVFERRASGWFVTRFERAYIYIKAGSSTIIFKQAHHERAVKVLSGNYFLAAVTAEESK